MRTIDRIRLRSVFLLTVLAGTVRVWNAASIPGFRFDEIGENILACRILLGKTFPLTNNAKFIGAFYNYLIALVFYVFGPDMRMARAVMVVSGTLTVILTFLLAYDVFGRETALISAFLLILAPGHILVASHVAWSASLSPLFVISTLLFFYRAVELRQLKSWLWVGLSAGLAIQVHPSSVIGVILAPLTYLAVTRRIYSTLRSRGFIFAIAGFLLGYSNMVVYNIIRPAGSLSAMFQARWTGTAHPISPAIYVSRLRFILAEFATLLCAGVPIVTVRFLVRTPLFYIYLLTLGLSLLFATWRGSRQSLLLLLVLLWGFMILPVVTLGKASLGLWGFAWGPHYLQMLLPPTFILVAQSLYSIWNPLSKNSTRLPQKKKHNLIEIVRKPTVVLLFLIMLLWPLQNLINFYSFCQNSLLTNQPIIDAIKYIRSQAVPKTSLYIDPYAFQSRVLAGVSLIELPHIRLFAPPLSPLQPTSWTGLLSFLSARTYTRPSPIRS